MWSNGTIDGYDYWVKRYEEGSVHGIDGGRISKLIIRKHGDNKDLCNFDRGWDIEPADEVKIIYDQLIRQYN